MFYIEFPKHGLAFLKDRKTAYAVDILQNRLYINQKMNGKRRKE